MSACTGGSWKFFWHERILQTVLLSVILMTGEHLWTRLCTRSSCKSSPQREFLHVFVNYFHGQMTLNTMCRSRVSTSVNSTMFQQTRLIYKQLCTVEAAGGFFASVNSHMCHQWFLYQETIWCFFQLIFCP